MVAQLCNPSSKEVEAGVLMEAQGHLELYCDLQPSLD